MNTNALTTPTSRDYSLEQILQSTQPPSQPSGFRRILGGLIGGVGNMFAPGIGGLIGSAIGGTGGLGGFGSMGNSQAYLQLQQQMYMQQEAIETASAVMKSRHDATMSTIRNIN